MWMIKKARDWICHRNDTPDYKQIVEKTLALFGVFTGATLSFYVKDFVFGEKIPTGFRDFPFWGRILVAVSVMALLLRYIVGSAVHLNATYVPKVTTKIGVAVGGFQPVIEEKQPTSASMCWLFFDMAVLVGFGMLAVAIIYSTDFGQFLLHSSYYILAGLLWSVVAMLWRPGDARIAKSWLAIDLSQFILTWGLIELPCDDLIRAALLASIYLVFLFLDFCVVSRPAPAVVAPPG
jgi:hypothetical protein